MTYKQIIIDGVDVSGCCFYNSDGECCTSRVWEGYCKDCRKCMYKLEQQLKAELQEIREEFGIETLYWKDPNERPHRTHRSLKFLKLKQALTEIKEIINICIVNNCNSECEFYKMDDCQDERLHRIRQILQKCEVLDEN